MSLAPANRQQRRPRPLAQHRDVSPTPIPRLTLTYQEAALAAGVSDRLIRREVAARRLAVVRIGRRCCRIRVQDLQRWIDARVSRPARRHHSEYEA